jgi:hypothetical protein
MNEVIHRLGNDRPSFHPVHSRIRAIGPRLFHHAKGRGRLLHTWQRPPTRSELEALTDDRIRSEVLVREALALGLDRDDTIIRRRLRQKMEFLSEEQAAQGTPTDRDLLAHLEAHPDQFRTDPLLSFRHVFLDPEQRGDDLDAEARRLLARLNGPQPPADPSSLGDPRLLVEPLLTGMPKAEVAAILG